MTDTSWTEEFKGMGSHAHRGEPEPPDPTARAALHDGPGLYDDGPVIIPTRRRGGLEAMVADAHRHFKAEAAADRDHSGRRPLDPDTVAAENARFGPSTSVAKLTGGTP
jgi:hypothetical protein